MTHTMLTLGTPKFKRQFEQQRVPMFITPCITPDPIVGSNVLIDPGFETTSTIPLYTVSEEAWGQSFQLQWQVVTTSPDAGTYHARLNQYSTAGGGPHFLFPLLPGSCIPEGFVAGNRASARVSSGHVVEWSVRSRHVSLTSGGPPELSMSLNWYTEGGTSLGDESLFDEPLTSSYVTYSVSAVMPATAFWIVCEVEIFYNFPNDECQVDMDTTGVSVS